MGKHVLNKLSATGINRLSERGYYADGGGLYFRVSEFSTRLWAFRYTLVGKAREMGLGAYPDVTLKEDRERAAEARKSLRDGIDPIDQKRSVRAAMIAAHESALSFDKCAEVYIAAHRAGWKNAKHADQWTNTIKTYASPIAGAVSVNLIDTATLMRILEPIWTTKTETASRLRGRIESILDWATVRGYRTGDNPARWTGHLSELLPKPSKVAKAGHHAALPYQEVGAFMAALREQAGLGARALEFAILTASRSGEVRGATWAEVDIDGAEWIIPANRMKAEKEHRIPLSDAALKLLAALPRLDGSELIFPNGKGTPLSDMTLTAVLRRMERGDITAHGFRSTFRDWAGETSAYPREVIEHALAHLLKDKAEASYARGTLFDKRRHLMADWAKYCSTVATAANVTPINRKTAA